MKKLPKRLFFFAYFIVLTLIFISFYYYHLFNQSDSFKRNFVTQNAREIYSVNTNELIKKLDTYSNLDSLQCIHASSGQANKVFYSTDNSSCVGGIFFKKITIEIPEANNSFYSFQFRLSNDFNTIFSLFYIMCLLIFVVIYLSLEKIYFLKNLLLENHYKLTTQMAHDIRSPLALLETIADSNDIQQIKIHLKSSITRIKLISNDLLLQNNNKKKSVKNIIPILKDLIAQKEIELKIRIDTNFQNFQNILVEFNELELSRVVSNLINNSYEAISNKKKIKIDIILDLFDNQLQIIFLDNGIGIPSFVVTALGAKLMSTKENGNGLGLSHAYSVITNMQGSLYIDQSYKNGCKIILTIPTIKTVDTKPDDYCILVDDDELTQLNWIYKAKKSQIHLKVFKTKSELLSEIHSIPKTTHFYIDSELGSDKGEVLAFELFNLGFNSLFITTGHTPERFSDLKFIKRVIDKNPPF